MSKRLLYLEDLYDFYSNTYKRSTHFSAEKSGNPIVVHVHGKVNFEESNKDTEGLCPVHLQACHTNLNLNGSYISESVMESALPSFSNRPILGYIHNVDGQWEFYSHNMHEDENGEIVYDEKPIGIIPESCNAQLIYDEDKKKTYCEVDGYIFEEYSKAAEILQREEECSVSVELSIRSLSYNAKDKYLNIEDFFFSGVTILGKTPDGYDVNPGMANSNIKLADFSADKNSLFEDYESKMVELQERLAKVESACFNDINDNSRKEETRVDNKDFEEVTEEVTETEETTEEEVTTEDNDPEETVDETSEEVVVEENALVEGTTEQTFEKMVRTYELSHEDVRYALYELLAPVEQADNEWYFINSVYDTHFTYENWDGDKIFGQDYVKDGDNVSFDGERITLHRELLTDSEYAELQSMRSNYAALKEFKETTEKNELHAQREEILASEKYEAVSETEAFKELVKNMDNYSLDELEKEAKIIFADNITMETFAVHTDAKKSTVKVFANVNKTKKDNRYGNLFSK